jgi:hypothetical protein
MHAIAHDSLREESVLIIDLIESTWASLKRLSAVGPVTRPQGITHGPPPHIA